MNDPIGWAFIAAVWLMVLTATAGALGWAVWGLKRLVSSESGVPPEALRHIEEDLQRARLEAAGANARLDELGQKLEFLEALLERADRGTLPAAPEDAAGAEPRRAVPGPGEDGA